MSNPQLEDGYTRIANEILGALAHVHLSGREWNVLIFVIRKTYGFGKKQDRIALSQIMQATGMQRSHVSRTLKLLILKNIITPSGHDTENHLYLIGLNKDYRTWKCEGSQRAKLGTCQIGNVPNLVTKGAQSGNRGVPNLVTTKERDTKEKQKKEKVPAAPVRPAGRTAIPFDDFFNEYERCSGRKIMTRNQARKGHLKARLDEFTREQIFEAWARMGVDKGLRGDNKTGVDYFSFEYAVRAQNIENYLNKNSLARKAEAKKQEPKARPKERVIRPDGTEIEIEL
jgi:phage replication O-like protein O